MSTENSNDNKNNENTANTEKKGGCPKNLPNILTVARAILVPVFMAAVIFDVGGGDATRVIGALLFAAISFTDMLDGKLARKYGLVTDFGKFLDPLADKLLVLGAMLSLIVYMSDDRVFSILVAFSTFIVILRELAVTSLRLICKTGGGKVIAANMAGKVKTVSQIIFVIAALIEPLLWEMPVLTYTSLFVMVFMTVYSGINYFKIYLPSLRGENAEK